MKTILLIRHGLTEGNLEKRYIGATDQPLCPQGEDQARALARRLPPCGRLLSSPMLRCRQTAALAFPGGEARLVEDLRECDFGRFEGKNAQELSGDPDYLAWVEAGCETPIPGGEAVGAFKDRCAQAFLRAALETPEGGRAALVTHGGCIMAILERFARPARPFYQWHIENCQCVECLWDGQTLTIRGEAPC